VNEPNNHTAWIDRHEDTWVRDDASPGCNGSTWWPLTDGPGWDEWARNGVGQPRDWSQVEEYGPFTRAHSHRTARALERVRQEAAL
jgi:hypothetical protein